MKLTMPVQPANGYRSPSSRRAWIEIQTDFSPICYQNGRPPRGGRGLKFKMIENADSLEQSPSSRRAWIEMKTQYLPAPLSMVALLAEGVD